MHGRHLTQVGSKWIFQIRVPARFKLLQSLSPFRVNLGTIGKAEAQSRARAMALAAQKAFRRTQDFLMANPDDSHSLVDGDAIRRQICKNIQTDLSWFLPMLEGIDAIAPDLDHGPRDKARDIADWLIMTDFFRRVGCHPVDGPPAGRVFEAYSGIEDHNDYIMRRLQADPQKSVEAQLNDIRQALGKIAGSETVTRRAPYFSEAAEEYIEEMRVSVGYGKGELSYLKLRAQVFLTICGDKRCDEYSKKEINFFIDRASYLPPNFSKRSHFNFDDLQLMVDDNKNCMGPRISKKTLVDGYLGVIKTILREGCQSVSMVYPLSEARFRIPSHVSISQTKELAPPSSLDVVFRLGISTGLLVEAVLPLLGLLTGRRLGLLVYMRAEEISEVGASWTVQPQSHFVDDDKEVRVPFKTAESVSQYVLHDFLAEIGFIDWARRQKGFIFRSLHEAADPADAASSRHQRLFRAAGVDPRQFKMFHGLRHHKADALRDADLGGRIARVQLGHELGDEHEGYGTRLRLSDKRKIAKMDLPSGIDFSVFFGLDFDRLAAARPRPGARLYRPRILSDENSHHKR